MNGVKSNIPTLGMIRRRGASIGSVTLYRILNSKLVGFGENQERITLARIARVSTSHRSSRKSIRYVTVAHHPAFWLYRRRHSPLA